MVINKVANKLMLRAINVIVSVFILADCQILESCSNTNSSSSRLNSSSNDSVLVQEADSLAISQGIITVKYSTEIFELYDNYSISYMDVVTLKNKMDGGETRVQAIPYIASSIDFYVITLNLDIPDFEKWGRDSLYFYDFYNIEELATNHYRINVPSSTHTIRYEFWNDLNYSYCIRMIHPIVNDSLVKASKNVDCSVRISANPYRISRDKVVNDIIAHLNETAPHKLLGDSYLHEVKLSNDKKEISFKIVDNDASSSSFSNLISLMDFLVSRWPTLGMALYNHNDHYLEALTIRVENQDEKYVFPQLIGQREYMGSSRIMLYPPKDTYQEIK